MWWPRRHPRVDKILECTMRHRVYYLVYVKERKGKEQAKRYDLSLIDSEIISHAILISPWSKDLWVAIKVIIQRWHVLLHVNCCKETLLTRMVVADLECEGFYGNKIHETDDNSTFDRGGAITDHGLCEGWRLKLTCTPYSYVITHLKVIYSLYRVPKMKIRQFPTLVAMAQWQRVSFRCWRFRVQVLVAI